jgi:hypothetical protein
VIATVTGRHARPPSLVTFLRWVIACLDAWILGATGGRHEAAVRPVAPRPEFGADPEWGDTLRSWAMDGWDRAMLMPSSDDADGGA